MSGKKTKGTFSFTKIGGIVHKIAEKVSIHIDDGSEEKEYIPTGIYVLNAALSGSLYGGILSNRITCFAGESGVGKSFVAYNTAREAQKKGFKVIYIDTENAIEFEDLKMYGIDISEESFMLIRSNVVEDIKMVMAQLLTQLKDAKQGGYDLDKIFIIMDSIGQLASRKEVEDARDGKEKADMTRAKQIRSLFRIITADLGFLKIPMLVIGQGYYTQDMFPQFKINGGDGIRYSASTIIMLSKAKLKTGAEDEMDIGQSGIVVTAKSDKNRLAKPKKVKFEIDFTRGCNPYKGLEMWCTPENYEKIGIAQGKAEVDKSTGEIIFRPGGNRWYVSHLGKSFPSSQIHTKEIFSQNVLDKMEPIIVEYFKYRSMEEIEEFEKLSEIKYDEIKESRDLDIDEIDGENLFEL